MNYLIYPQKKVFTSRDMRFHETIFPYAFVTLNPTLSYFPIDFGPIPLMTTTSLHSSTHPSPPTLSPPATTPPPPPPPKAL